jgi:hypothetical protein
MQVFAAAVKHRPRIRLTIRQRERVLEQWPVSAAHSIACHRGESDGRTR